jgi:hypothetical protein
VLDPAASTFNACGARADRSALERVVLSRRLMRSIARASLVASLLSLTAVACGSKEEPPARPVTPAAAARRAPGANDWIPSEHRTSKGKLRDPGVYVDGAPVGFLQVGDLPPSLEPVLVEGTMQLEFGPGDTGPRRQPVHYLRYRLADYLERVGVELGRVREVHVYGGPRIAGRITGPDLRRARERILFSFGRKTHGKALLHLPADVELGTSFDHIAAVAVYLEREPPRILPSAEVELAGRIVTDIPYYGEPLRGGIRVYKDDRLVTVIKRRLLAGEDRLAGWHDGRLRWQLADVLGELGVALDDVSFAQLIYDERRGRRIPASELRATWFVADPQRRGEVALGERAEPVHGLALFTAR